MLKLICDRCGFELELIHHMEPKDAKTNPSDGQGWRSWWEISNEQSGIGGTGYNNRGYFDKDPQEFQNIDWSAGIGKPNEWYINAHLCNACKVAYKGAISEYKKITINLSSEASIAEIDRLLAKHKEDYKKDFLKNL